MRRSSRRQRCRSVEPRERIRDDLRPIHQIEAGVLDVGYVDAGPPDGPAVLLLHGWPYDVQSYAEATPILAAAGLRVVVPYLRGYGSTRFLAEDTPRNGQQAALAVDVVALMDALEDRTCGPRRIRLGRPNCGDRRRLVARTRQGARLGQRLPDRQPSANRMPLPPRAELAWWYQFYFATERGRLGYARTPRVQSADLGDCLPEMVVRRRHVRSDRGLVRQPRPRRHRHPQLPLADRDRRRGSAVRRPRGAARGRAGDRCPDDHDGRRCQRRAPPGARGVPNEVQRARTSTGSSTGGVGHNLPQEAPEAFARAVIDVDRF